MLPILRQLRGESYLYGLIHQSHQGGEPSKISQEKKDGRRGFDGVDTTINTRNPHASTPSPNRLNDKSKSKYQKYYDIYLVLIAVILCQRRKKLEKEARLTALRSKMRYSLIQSSHLQSQPSVALIQAQFEREWPKRWR